MLPVCKYFASTIEKNPDRIKPEVYPASQLGTIPRQIEGTQFGFIQSAILPPKFIVGVDLRFQANRGQISSACMHRGGMKGRFCSA
jgi:TRAP-type C4-dicarboxylate transport system substrate-binding protein